MVVARAHLIAVARTWLGTRWVHLGRTKDVGVDCIGFILGVAHEAGCVDTPPALEAYRREGEITALFARCRELGLVHVFRAQASAADIAVFRHGTLVHVGLITALQTGPGLIHCYAQSRKVVEHTLDAQWQARMVAAYRLPRVET